jgi:uncharacterized protein YdaU (DUF1376 family)
MQIFIECKIIPLKQAKNTPLLSSLKQLKIVCAHTLKAWNKIKFILLHKILNKSID